MVKEVTEFHKYFYKNWKKSKWMGINCVQYPTDMILIQELIYNIKPDFVIETGTNVGGSSLFYACIMEMMGKGQVITVDKELKCDYTKQQSINGFKRLIHIEGNSVDDLVIKKIKEYLGNEEFFKKNIKCIVILDSLHSMGHVLKEIELYKQFVNVGSYLIVQDSDIGGHPVWPDYGNGPYEAISKFMKNNDEFVIDKDLENRFFLTCSPNGYLKRVK